MGGPSSLENGETRTEVKDWDGPDDPVESINPYEQVQS